MREAREIFAYYRINSECPPIEEILYDQEGIRRLKSTDYAAYNENLRKKVPPAILINKISEQNDQFSIGNNGLSCAQIKVAKIAL